MKAAICRTFGEPLAVEQVTLGAPQRGEVRVRLAATAICHSDIHLMRGEWFPRRPIIPGHEAAGVVEEIGEGVTLTQPGDRVVVSLLRYCGHCLACTTDSSFPCEQKYPLDWEKRIHDASGEGIYRGLFAGAFAEEVLVDQSQVVRVPPEIGLEQAALLACGVVTGVGSAINVARVTPGSSVVVTGTGGVGLNAVQGARIAGAARIIALDTLDNKLAAAREFGATATVNVATEDARARVRELTGGRGADFVLVTVGSPAAMSQGLTLTRPGGTLVLTGLPPWDATMSLTLAPFANAGQRILGSFMGAARISRDVPWLVELYLQGRLKLDELITQRYPLEQINEAVASMERGEALRNVIVFDAAA